MPARRLLIVGLGDSTTAGTPAFRSPLEAPPNGQGNPESQYAHWMMKAHPDWTVLTYDRAIPRATAAIFTVNTWIESFAKVLDIPFADTHAAVAAPDAPHRLRGSPDGMHPDVDGYRWMGDTLTRTIEAHLLRHASR